MSLIKINGVDVRPSDAVLFAMLLVAAWGALVIITGGVAISAWAVMFWIEQFQTVLNFWRG